MSLRVFTEGYPVKNTSQRLTIYGPHPLICHFVAATRPLIFS